MSEYDYEAIRELLGRIDPEDIRELRARFDTEGEAGDTDV